MAYAEFPPELSWLLTLLCLSAIILLLAMCVCTKQTEKAYFQNQTHDYGTAGRLSMTRDSPIFQHNVSNGSAVATKSTEDEVTEEDGTSKRNSWTVKDRALPDIPEAGVLPSNTDGSEEKTNTIDEEVVSQPKKKSHNKSAAPKPPAIEATVIDIPPENSSQKDPPHVMKITINENPKDSIASTSSNTFNSRSWNTRVLSSNPGTSDGVGVLKNICNSSLNDTTDSSPIRRLSDSDAYNCNPYAEPHLDAISLSSSPVCIRICGSDSSASNSVFSTPAGLAVAGAIPSSDIPYMTPPLLHNQAPSTSTEDGTQHNRDSLGVRSEVPYNVISVREPLARVREITRRKQRNPTPQNSLEGENHYAMVPEEEQMYAEIGSGQDSGSSSITYAHIEPRELPPVPPTVESLKSVAHAHSRQASTVSNSSFGSCVSGSTGSTSPTQPRNNLSSLYSSVEKNVKQRRTIHIAEGASVMSGFEKHKKVEDLYAKVSKKRVELTLSSEGYQDIGGEDCMTPPPSPWASTTPPAPPPIAGRLHAASLGVASGNTKHNRRHSADPNLNEKLKTIEPLENDHFLYSSVSKDTVEPGYEQIYNDDNNNDSCYEKIKDGSLAGSDGKAGYESIRQPDSNGFSFPDYASVKENDKYLSDPGYECVAQMDSLSTDPGYEPVRISVNSEDKIFSNHSYISVNNDDDDDAIEPNYETVNKIYRTDSNAVDPGYERVNKLSRTNSDTTDPGYERVGTGVSDPGYEEVNRLESDSDPGYEIVQHRKTSVRSKGSAAAVANNGNDRTQNNTVVIVSGTTSVKVLEKEPISKNMEPSGDHDSNATFL